MDTYSNKDRAMIWNSGSTFPQKQCHKRGCCSTVIHKRPLYPIMLTATPQDKCPWMTSVWGATVNGTHVRSQAAFWEKQLSWVWKMKRLFFRRQGGRGIPGRGKSNAEAWRYTEEGAPREVQWFGLTREGMWGMRGAQEDRQSGPDQKAAERQATE